MKTLGNLSVLAMVVLTLTSCGGGGGSDGGSPTTTTAISDGGITAVSGGEPGETAGGTPPATTTPGATPTPGGRAGDTPAESLLEEEVPTEAAPPEAAPPVAAPDINHADVCRIPLMDDKNLNKIILDRMYKDVRTEEDERRMLATSFTVPPDPVVVTSHIPNDPNVAGNPELDWPLRRIAAFGAWAVARGDANVVVALLDTGVRADHPDLDGNIIPGYDFVNNDDNPADDNGHGTRMAGLIVAHIDNGLGSAGIAPVCRLLAVKVADKEGLIDPDNLTKGIRYATGRGVAVICIPGGVAEGDAEMKAAVREAAAKGILLVAAAGSHDDASRADYPAAYDEVLEVAGTEIRDIPSRFCTLSAKAEVAAPAEGNLVTTIGNDKYGPTDGTSAACALVAGAAALVKSVNKGLTPDQIRQILRLSGDDIRIVEFRDRYKARRLNVDRAVRTATTGNGDLLIGGVTYLPESPRAGTSLTVTIRAANGGLKPVKDGAIRCLLIEREGGEVLSEKAVSLPEIRGLEEHATVVKLALPDRAALCRLEIALLQGSRTVTTERHGPVEIAPGDAPEMEVVALESGESDVADGTVEITAVVRNRGNVAVRDSCLVVAVSDGTNWHEVFDGEFAPGEERTFRFTWTKPVEHRQKIYGIVALVAPAEGETEILDNKMVHNIRLLDPTHLGRVAYTDLPAHEIIIDAPWMVCQGKDVPVLLFVGESGPPETRWRYSPFGSETIITSTQLYLLAMEMRPGSEFSGELPDPTGAIFYDGLSGAPRTPMAGYAIVDAEGNVAEGGVRFNVIHDRFFNAKLETSPIELNTLHKIVRVPRAALTIREENGVDVAYIGVTVAYRRQITTTMTSTYATWGGSKTESKSSISYEKNPETGIIALFQWRKMLRVEIHKEHFPRLAADRDYDAHYHTIAEYTTRTNITAPKQALGGPLEMLVESAYALGMIEETAKKRTPTILDQETRNKIVTTDHNCFYSDDESPKVGPTADAGHAEHAVMRDEERGIGRTAGEELGIKWKEGEERVGRHMLAYEASHFDGTWHSGRMPVAGRALGLLTNNPNTVFSVFATLTGDRGWGYAAHPFLGDDDKFVWNEGMLKEALSLDPRTTAYIYMDDKGGNFVFKGLQVWNQRQTRLVPGVTRSSLSNLNPFTEFRFLGENWSQWISDEEAYSRTLEKGIDQWERYIQQGLRYAFATTPDVVFQRKIYILAGTDAHGEFNYSDGHDSTILPETLFGYENHPTISNNAFGKARTHAFVANDGDRRHAWIDDLVKEPPAADDPSPGYLGFRRFSHGRCIVTDGPVLEFQTDAQPQFDSERMEWTTNLDEGSAPFNPDGRIGGRGSFDGGFTMLMPLGYYQHLNFRYRWNNTAPFGNGILSTGLTMIRKWGTSHWVDTNAPPPPGGWHRETYRIIDIPVIGESNDPKFTPFAFYMSATATDPKGGHYRCYTNPIWVIPVEMTAQTTWTGKETEGIATIILDVDCVFASSMKADDMGGDIRFVGLGGVPVAIPLAGGTWSSRDGMKNARYTLRQIVTFPNLDPETGSRFLPANYLVVFKSPRDVNGNLLNAIATEALLVRAPDPGIFKADPNAR